MQGVAAKNDASCDLSRARASVTGQTTIAASTAATPMTPPPSEKSGLAKDLIVILGLPALLLSVGAWYYWETIFPVYRAPSEDAVFDVATGVWDWQSHEGFCKDNPHTEASPRTARSWSSPAAARGVTLPRLMIASPCTISLSTPPPISAVICAMRPEHGVGQGRRLRPRPHLSRWIRVASNRLGSRNADMRNWTLSCRDRFAHRASWRGALANSLGRAI